MKESTEDSKTEEPNPQEKSTIKVNEFTQENSKAVFVPCHRSEEIQVITLQSNRLSIRIKFNNIFSIIGSAVKITNLRRRTSYYGNYKRKRCSSSLWGDRIG